MGRVSTAAWGAPLAALLLGGCVTPMMNSQPPSAEAPKGARLLGEYGLAQSVLTVTISAPGADAAKDEKPTSVVVNNTVSANAAAPAPAPQPAAGPKTPESEAAWCADLRKAYYLDRVKTLEFFQTHNAFVAKLDSWGAQASFSSEEQAKIRKAIAAYEAARLSYEEVYARALANVELMAQDRFGRTDAIEPLCPQRVKVDIKETVEVDRRTAYRLYAASNNYSSDHWVAEFDGGLPKAISGTADHKLGDIVVNAARSIASVQALGVAPAAPDSLGLWEKFAPPRARLTDAITPETVRRYRRQLTPPKVLASIDVTLPIVRAFTIDGLDGKRANLNDTLRIAVVANCSPATAPAGQTGEPRAGIVVSSSRACEVLVPATAEYKPGKNGAPLAASSSPLARAKIWALDSNRPMILPVERTAMVKTSTAYTFTAGRPSKVDYDRPAPAMEVVSLPFKVIGGFAGAMLEGVKGKTGQVQASTDLTKAETARLEAAAALAEARQKASAAP